MNLKSLVGWGVVLLMGALGGCNIPLIGEHDEGMIRYKLSFPYNKEDLITELFPDEMKVYFAGNKMAAEMSSMGGLVSTFFIIDNEKKLYKQYLKNFNERFSISLDEQGVEQWLGRQEKFVITHGDKEVELAGLPCRQATASFVNDSIPPVELWYTSGIEVPSPNWFTPYNEIEGMLLAYEMRQYGLRMKLVATEVKFQRVPSEKFVASGSYTEITLDQLDQLMAELTGLK